MSVARSIRSTWYSLTDQAMRSVGVLPKSGISQHRSPGACLLSRRLSDGYDGAPAATNLRGVQPARECPSYQSPLTREYASLSGTGRHTVVRHLTRGGFHDVT